ncbi:MAG TPA: hypothetical protein VFB12_22790 [Ktedonobacteraceae bacterium]|nr:hypothetical protein [Ktedonobacteraceae bacterium]
MKCYIHIKGHLDPCWQDWFEGLTIVQEDEGTSRLSGSLRDQAALYGILIKIRGLGLSLLQLSTSEAVAPSESGNPLERRKQQEKEENDEHQDGLWHAFGE